MLATLKKKFGNMKAAMPGKPAAPAPATNEAQRVAYDNAMYKSSKEVSAIRDATREQSTASTTVYQHMQDQRRFEAEAVASGRRDAGHSLPPPGGVANTLTAGSEKNNSFMA